ncbi:winged helix-turn-helix transcriptional regulator [Kitasatospora kifunensis]|uniref:DNA-binding HxlR family transcriptional regulator n=1 Tax=Kitasatospora kifunensis TaxID=58351 RepID=A0A7W7R2N5_KITKI|nr:helix-turn-helix domain-containing protein [Kitasatospora kifunensis]MBB4924287.1 DNA-binding HxlR family transcriptional regulator [Kitasatospora kifunensis]
MNDSDQDRCPCRPLLDRLGDRWSVLLLVTLQEGPAHYGDLNRRIGDISRKILTQTLRSLERDGLVIRTVLPDSVVKVRYELSPLGHSLAEPLSAIRSWIDHHQPTVEAHQRAYDARTDDLGVTELRRRRSGTRAGTRAGWSKSTQPARVPVGG